MKKIMLLLMSVLVFSAQAAQLSAFQDVVNAVNEGKALTFVASFSHCQSDELLPDSVASIRPNAVLVLGGKRVTASDRHFTLNDPSFPGVPLFGYSKFNLNDDGSAFLNITLMKASDYSIVKSFDVRCELGDGFKVIAS